MTRWRVSSRPVVATLLVLGLIAAGTGAGWATAANSGPAQAGDSAIRAAAAVVAVGRHARSLAETASARTRADLSPEAMTEFNASINADLAAARRQLDQLARAGHADAAARLDVLLTDLERHAERLESGRLQIARILRDSQTRREELIAATNWQLLPAIVASEDDFFYRMVSGHGDADAQPARTGGGATSTEDLLLYAQLALLAQQVDQGYISLEITTRLTDKEFIGTLEENANLVMYQLRESIDRYVDTGREELDPTLVSHVRDLVDAAYGEENLIDLMKTRLRLDEQEARLADAINTVMLSFRAEADAVFEQAVGDLALPGTYRETASALQAAMSVSQHAAAATSHWSVQTTANTSVDDMPGIRETVAVHVSGLRN
ncbi:MAG: hypothetical protein OXG71_05850, partial [Rhodospirillales bacterium]|nr:hypothetical protein [Rhodospirillales bacterium]